MTARKAPFEAAVKAFDEGYGKVCNDPEHPEFWALPKVCGSYEWRRRMFYEVGARLDAAGWNLPDLVREAERRAFGHVRQGGKASVSCSVASPNSIRRLWAALRRIENALPRQDPSPKAPNAPGDDYGGLPGLW